MKKTFIVEAEVEIIGTPMGYEDLPEMLESCFGTSETTRSYVVKATSPKRAIKALVKQWGDGCDEVMTRAYGVYTRAVVYEIVSIKESNKFDIRKFEDRECVRYTNGKGRKLERKLERRDRRIF